MSEMSENFGHMSEIESRKCPKKKMEDKYTAWGG